MLVKLILRSVTNLFAVITKPLYKIILSINEHDIIIFSNFTEIALIANNAYAHILTLLLVILKLFMYSFLVSISNNGV